MIIHKRLLLSATALCVLSSSQVQVSAQDQFTNTLTFESSTFAYHWQTSPWSNCNGVCFVGEQVRSVSCRDNSGDTVPPSNCDHTAVPETSRECPLPACAWTEPSCRSGSPYRYGVPSRDGSNPAPTTDEYWRINAATNRLEGFVNGQRIHEGEPPPSPTGNSNSGGGKVICGHFYTRGILPYHIYMGDIAYAEQKASESTKRGYRLWAVPLTRHLNENPGGIAEKIIQPFALGWAEEMAYKMGFSYKGNIIGKILSVTGEPIARFIGLFVADTNWTELKSEQKIWGKA